MKGKPSVVTPTAAVGTPNPFTALAEAEVTTEPAEVVLEIPSRSSTGDLQGQVPPKPSCPRATVNWTIRHQC